MANKVYINPETARTWQASGGDELMDLGGLAADAVAMGSYWDLGAGARASRYSFELFIDGFDASPTVLDGVRAYLALSDKTTEFDGPPTTDPTDTAEGTATTDQLSNMWHIGTAVVTSTTAGKEAKVSGTIQITHRYVSPVIHNDTAVALLSTADAHRFVLTPIPDEVQ